MRLPVSRTTWQFWNLGNKSLIVLTPVNDHFIFRLRHLSLPRACIGQSPGGPASPGRACSSSLLVEYLGFLPRLPWRRCNGSLEFSPRIQERGAGCANPKKRCWRPHFPAGPLEALVACAPSYGKV